MVSREEGSYSHEELLKQVKDKRPTNRNRQQNR